MKFTALQCPACGGPLPPGALGSVVVCTYCKQTLARDPRVVFAATFKAARARLLREAAEGDPAPVVVADAQYRLRGRLGVGESCDVFLAERAAPAEVVVIKVLRARGDEDLLRREFETLTALTHDGGPSAHFAQLVPAPVAIGAIDHPSGRSASIDPPRFDSSGGIARRPAAVYRYAPGFAHTLVEAREAYPHGIAGEAGAWIWRRLLELLGWIHQRGFVHGAVLPQHVVIHARDHGVRLVGFTAAQRCGAALTSRVASGAPYYPDLAALGEPASPQVDIAMAARVVARALADVPRPLADLLAEQAERPGLDAWAVRSEVGRAAEASFGPPRYRRFVLPGWFGA